MPGVDDDDDSSSSSEDDEDGADKGATASATGNSGSQPKVDQGEEFLEGPLATGIAGRGDKKRRRELTSRAKTAGQWATRRLRARRRVEQGVALLHEVLTEQRLLYEQAQPSPADELLNGIGLEQAEQRRREAYMQLSTTESAYLHSLALVRECEAAIKPQVVRLPAVIGLAVSAPGTTWAVDDWTETTTPLPDVASSLKRAFLAAFSYKDPTMNRVPLKYKHVAGHGAGGQRRKAGEKGGQERKNPGKNEE